MTRKNIFLWAIYVEKDSNGYLNLKLEKADGRKKEIIAFTTIQEGKNALKLITTQYQLCSKLTGLSDSNTVCITQATHPCDGACMLKIFPAEYNARVQAFINNNLFENKNMIIIDRGRKIGEHSAILIEKGVYKGYAFYDLNYQIHKPDILKNILIPMLNNRETKLYIQGYLRKNKVIKIIHF